jgi:hypothetical protein
MRTSIDACIIECSLPTDRAPSVIEISRAHRGSVRSNDSLVLAPVSPQKMDLEDLEFSDIGRDPRFMNGRWLGLAIVIAAALCAFYIGVVSVWAALALAVVW